MATARIGASVAFFFSPIIASGIPYRSVLFGVVLLTIGFLTFLVYVLFLDIPLSKQIKDNAEGQESSEEEFRISDLGKIVSNRGFWYIALLCVLFYSGVFPFLKYAVNMMQSKLGISPELGGMIAGLLRRNHPAYTHFWKHG